MQVTTAVNEYFQEINSNAKINLPNQEYYVWKTLLESQVSQKLFIMAKFSPLAQKTLNRFYYNYYNTHRQLFGIKKKVIPNSLLNTNF